MPLFLSTTSNPDKLIQFEFAPPPPHTTQIQKTSSIFGLCGSDVSKDQVAPHPGSANEVRLQHNISGTN